MLSLFLFYFGWGGDPDVITLHFLGGFQVLGAIISGRMEELRAAVLEQQRQQSGETLEEQARRHSPEFDGSEDRREEKSKEEDDPGRLMDSPLLPATEMKDWEGLPPSVEEIDDLERSLPIAAIIIEASEVDQDRDRLKEAPSLKTGDSQLLRVPNDRIERREMILEREESTKKSRKHSRSRSRDKHKKKRSKARSRSRDRHRHRSRSRPRSRSKPRSRSRSREERKHKT